MKHIQTLPMAQPNLTLVIKDLTDEIILHCIYDNNKQEFGPTVFSSYEIRNDGIHFNGIALSTTVYREFLRQRNG